MLKIGLFTRNLESIDSYQFTSNDTLLKIVGVYIHGHQNSSQETKYKVFDKIDDLLAKIDVALIDITGNEQITFASIAIKSGVNVFLASSQELSLASLSQLDMLSREIGVTMGVGQLGYNISVDNLHIEYPIIAEIKRNTSIASVQHFDSILKFDVATALNLTKNKIRKIRAYSLSSHSQIPSTLFTLIDFDNNSVITYTLNNTNNDSSFKVEIHHSTQTHSFEIPDPDRIEYKDLEFKNFISKLLNNTEPSHDIELASNTVFVTETIYSKIG